MKKLVGILFTIALMVRAVMADSPSSINSTASINPPPSSRYKDSRLSVEERVEDLLRQLTLEEKITMLGGNEFTLQEIKRLEIPPFSLSDASMGIRGHGKSTAYANGVALAGTWDIDQAKKVGVAVGRDARARGVNILLGPGMNLYRSPMCGRNFEYLGEDPILAGKLASAFIEGVQSQGVAVTAKHFVANDQEVDRNNLSSNVDERTLRELYLKPFQIALKNGALGVMTSYNLINGIHASQNDWLLNQFLKKEWGFKGIVMSDWGSCYDPLAMANGGMDIEMPNGKMFNTNNLLPLIEDGKISQATIDDKIRRQLRVAFTLGWFDRPQQDSSIPLDDPSSAAVALEGARDSVTLLKNDQGLLPLDPAKVKKIVLLGHNAHPAVIGGGGSAIVDPLHAVSVYDAVSSMANRGTKVVLVPWKRTLNRKGPEALDANGVEGSAPIPSEYIEEVKTADAVIVCVGFSQTPDFKYRESTPDHYDQEGEAGNRSYALPPGQVEVIKAAAALNTNTIVLLNAGGSVATEDWIANISTLLHAYYPGQDGGTAVAEIIFGKANPSGKLPFSWEKKWEDCAAYGNYPEYKVRPKENTYKEGVFLGYRWFDSKEIEPLFPFGFGLSYTTFSFKETTAKLDKNQNIEITTSVENTGARSGSEVVQLYIEPPKCKTPRPIRELKEFVKVSLKPGESKQVILHLPRADLAYWNPDTKNWTVTPGTYTACLGDSSRNLTQRVTFTID